MKYIAHSHEIEAESPVGGKARSLWALTQTGLPVPPWFVVLPDAFYKSMPAEARSSLEHARDPKEIWHLAEGVVPTGLVLDALKSAFVALCPKGQPVAVRSSAMEEDSAAYSFAGQLESYLFVDPADLPDRVAQVWRSGFSERIVAYRQQAGLGLLPKAPAVIVQRMILADVAGVAFSADPVSGRRSVAVVSGVWGLGSALVSGETDADTWRIDRAREIIGENISDKRMAHRPSRVHIEGVCAVPLPSEMNTTPCLDHQQVRAVAELARRAERFFGRPQDIEWAIEAGDLYLVQSRPITALATQADPDGLRAIWDNSNIIESYSGITTPLTFSFARRAYEEVYTQFCRLIGISERVIEQERGMFQCMLGLIKGRVYYNLLNWYRLVALLPGFKFNRAFMEQMMGVRESLPVEEATGLKTAGTGERIADALRLTRTLWRLGINFLTINRRIRRFYRRLQDTLGEGRPDLSALRPDELTAYYRRLERQLLPHWDAPIVNDFATMISFGILRKLTTAWVGDSDATLQNDLLCGESGMISGEPARLVKAMAQVALSEHELVRALREDSFPAIRRAMRHVPKFEEQYKMYIDRFGDRCMEELKLESPTLHDDPLPLLRAVGHYALKLQKGTVEAADHELHVRRRAEARVAKVLGLNILKRAIFGWVLRSARARVRDRENLRFERTRVFGRTRLIALEWGKRLVALDLLANPRDIFYLELDEVLAFVEGRATTTDLKGLVALRKEEFGHYRADEAPASRFETRGVLYVGHTFRESAMAPPPQGEMIQGLGCCPGVVRGPARLVWDPRSVSLASGEIIVTERTDPGWVIIFPSAAGLLVERGSLLSHSAIVARELGLPTVVALPGLMQWVRDGDWIEMDGSTGAVVKVPPSEEIP